MARHLLPPCLRAIRFIHWGSTNIAAPLFAPAAFGTEPGTGHLRFVLAFFASGVLYWSLFKQVAGRLVERGAGIPQLGLRCC
jgi:hypothetical protein